MTATNTKQENTIDDHITDCRLPERRRNLVRDYNITPSFRFIAPGFVTCGQPGRELEGVVSVFVAKRNSDGKLFFLVCGSFCANHFCQLLKQDRQPVEWPVLRDPYATESGHRPSRDSERSDSESRFRRPPESAWVAELEQVCTILLMRLGSSQGKLLSIFMKIKTGAYEEAQVLGVNTIASRLRPMLGFEDISDLATQLDARGPKKLWRPDFSLLEAIFKKRCADPSKEWVLR